MSFEARKMAALAALTASLNLAVAGENTLPTVAVTAKGYAADTLATPAAVTVIEREELSNLGAATPGDALRGKPGIAVHGDGAWGRNPVLRGLKKESLVLLVDGLRLNSAQPYGAIASLVDAGMLERIEAVKGPASVLHGSGALGGVVNLITPGAEFSATSQIKGRLAAQVASGGIGGGLSGRLAASNADQAFSVSVGIHHAGDYREPAGTVAGSGYDTQAVHGQYRLRLAPEHSLRLAMQQQVDKDVAYPGSRGTPAAPPGLGTVTIHSPRQERTLHEAGYEWKLGGAAPLTFNAAIYRQDVAREIRAASSTLGRDRARTRVEFATNGANLRADWLAHADHLLSLGSQQWTMKASPERHLFATPPYTVETRNDPFTNGRVESLGFFVQDQWTLERWQFTLGARHDAVDGHADRSGSGATTGLGRADRALSWSLGGIYAATPLVNPYFSIARAFRAADLRERFENSERGDGYFYLGNPQTTPEKALNFEVGLKGRAERGSYAVSAYRNRISDYIAGRPTGATQAGLPVKQTVNVGHATITGFEAEADYRFSGAHALTAAVSALRGENQSDNEPLYQMPADEVSLGWALRPSSGWGGDARLRLVARQDRIATRFTRGIENATPGFATADLGATWKSGAHGLRFALKNLLDKRYYEHLTEGSGGFEPRAPGRHLLVTYEGNF